MTKMDMNEAFREMRRIESDQQFEQRVRGILADHESATLRANGSDTHAARRRTFDKLIKAFRENGC